MSISTERGDDGTTDLLFGRRVAKTHPAVAALGEVDELNAALGLARTLSAQPRVQAAIGGWQAPLIGLMGEVATDPADADRYRTAGYARLTDADVDALTAAVHALETELNERFRDWAIPGAETTPGGAALDVARCVCRRAERAVLALGWAGTPAARYLNRLSDLLWLWARWEAKATA